MAATSCCCPDSIRNMQRTAMAAALIFTSISFLLPTMASSGSSEKEETAMVRVCDCLRGSVGSYIARLERHLLAVGACNIFWNKFGKS
jgi:type IV secretory pathway VirB2 component (pilin)